MPPDIPVIGATMIKPVCSKCGEEFHEFGGLLFSPPFDSREKSEQITRKLHLCPRCWEQLAIYWFDNSLRLEENYELELVIKELKHHLLPYHGGLIARLERLLAKRGYCERK